MKKIKGSVSLFAAMIFLLVVSVIMVSIKSAAIQGAKVRVSTALSMGLDSLFAEYDTKLFSQFGVLLFNGSTDGKTINKDALAGKIGEYMEYNIDTDKGLYFAKDTDLYGIDIKGISIDRIIKPTAAGGLIWQDMVVDYEKYAKVIDLAAGFMGIQESTEEAEAVEEITGKITEVSEKLIVVNEAARNMIQWVDGVKCTSGGMDIDHPLTNFMFIKKFCPFERTMEGMNIPYQKIVDAVAPNVENPLDYIDAATQYNSKGRQFTVEINNVRNLINTCMAPMNKAIELMETIEVNQKDIDMGIEMLGILIESKENVIQEETMEGIQEEYDRICEYNEIMLEDICDIEQMGIALRKNKDVFNEILEAIENIDYSQSKDELHEYLLKIRGLIGEISFEGIRFEYENLWIAEDNTDVLDSISEFLETGFLAIIVPEGETVSKRKFNESGLASDICSTEEAALVRKDCDGGTEMAKKLIYLEYIMDKFICFTDKGEGAALNYEAEYILFGHNSDIDNLTSTVLAMATIRSGVNMIYLISDTDKRESAYGLASNLVGATKMEPLIRVVQFLILYLWAYAEALMDVRSLLKGEEIALTKSDETWQLSIENLMSLNFEDTGVRQEGINYEEFIRFLLFIENDGKKSAYTMDLVELWMIAAGREDFRLSRYIYGLEVTTAYSAVGDSQYEEKAVYTY
ncbi:MAG: DUF5702 domain-containing protein [Butyrivibrio sp.]